MQREKGWPGGQIREVPQGHSPNGLEPWLPGTGREDGTAGSQLPACADTGVWVTDILQPGQVAPRSPYLVPLLVGRVHPSTHSFIYSFIQLLFTEDLQMCQALSRASGFSAVNRQTWSVPC